MKGFIDLKLIIKAIKIGNTMYDIIIALIVLYYFHNQLKKITLS